MKEWIHPFCSTYGAPLLFVHKKTDELCMCIDYIMLNKQPHTDRLPIPRIDNLRDHISSTAILSKINLTNAYHQVLFEDFH